MIKIRFRFLWANSLIAALFTVLLIDWWRATLWGKNLSDETYLKNYFNYAGTDMGVAALGRSFGFTLAAKW